MLFLLFIRQMASLLLLIRENWQNYPFEDIITMDIDGLEVLVSRPLSVGNRKFHQNCNGKRTVYDRRK